MLYSETRRPHAAEKRVITGYAASVRILRFVSEKNHLRAIAVHAAIALYKKNTGYAEKETKS